MSGALTLFVLAAVAAAAADPTTHKSSSVSHAMHKSGSASQLAAHKSSGAHHSSHKSSHSSGHHHHHQQQHQPSVASRASEATGSPALQMHSEHPAPKQEVTPAPARSGAASPVKRMGVPGKPVVGLFKNNFAAPNPATRGMRTDLPSKSTGLFGEKIHNMDSAVPGTRSGIPGRTGMFGRKIANDHQDPLGFSGEAQMQKKHGSHWFFDEATPSTHLRRAMTGVSGSAKALGNFGKKALVHLSSWPPQSPLATSKAAAKQQSQQSQQQQHQKPPQQHAQKPQLHQKQPIQYQHQHSSK